MKKWLKRFVILLGVFAFLWLIGFFRYLTTYNQIEKVVLKTYDHSEYGEVELTESETRLVITLYNLSRKAGEINAEPCCSEYGCGFYYKDGTKSWIMEGVKSKLLFTPRNGERCYMANPMLISYMKKLAAKYDMPIGG